MDMNNIDAGLDDIMTLNGALATALVDWESGMTLGTRSDGKFDIEMAAAGNTEVIKAKMAVMRNTGLGQHSIKDILITLDNQQHILMTVPTHPELFLYGAFSADTTLALARTKMKAVAAG
jgi:predicted regulator of Ras-like GTPase activity (Roadblock/LC7/MglB family)